MGDCLNRCHMNDPNNPPELIRPEEIRAEGVRLLVEPGGVKAPP